VRYVSDQLRNARLDVIAAAIGSGAQLKLFEGDQPHSCESADPPGDVLAVIDLPPQPFLPAAGGRLVSSNEPWRGLGLRRAKNGTVVQCFRIYDALGQCHIQGTVGTEGWCDLVLSTSKIAAGQPINISDFTLAELELTP
jgi:hypothetical protein